MKLGAFSNSLAVKDIHKSKAFYEKLGFSVFAGQIEKNYLIMKNGNALVGLFQGMFENNMMTFNPGWDESANKLDKFDDINICAIDVDIIKEIKTYDYPWRELIGFYGVIKFNDMYIKITAQDTLSPNIWYNLQYNVFVNIN